MSNNLAKCELSSEIWYAYYPASIINTWRCTIELLGRGLDGWLYCTKFLRRLVLWQYKSLAEVLLRGDVYDAKGAVVSHG